MSNFSDSSLEFAAQPVASRSADQVVAGTALRVATQGFRAEEHKLLLSMLGILKDRTEHPWIASDPETADLVIFAGQAADCSRSAVVTAVLLREGESCDDPDMLCVNAPLRVMQLMDLLNAACDRLGQQRFGEARTHEAPALRIEDDENSLAAALARLLESKAEQMLRVRVLGHGTVYLSTRERLFHVDFPLERLQTVLEAHRFVLTALPTSSSEFAAVRPACRRIEELLWCVGLATPWERADAGQFRFELVRWPDFARLPARQEHIRLCAALSVRPMRAAELARTTRIDRGEADHFLHAAWLCGAVSRAQAPIGAEPDPEPPPASAGGRGVGGLFERLWRRLGG